MLQAVDPVTKQIRVLVADDHPVVREGLAAILDDQPDMEVIGQANNGQEAIDLFRKHQPDIALLDLRMPQVGGVEAITTIRTEFPNACIIMLTIYDTDEDIYQGLRAGARAYMLKDTPCEEIIEVIRSVCAGNRYVPATIGEKLAAHAEHPTLSDREREILNLLASGKNNKAIAATLSISENTVKFHVNNILEKLGVCDRTSAVVTALRRGIIRL